MVAAAFQVSAQTAAQKYVGVLNGSEELKDAVWGVLAVKVGGDTVACYNANKRMLPASNTKLLTTGIALKELGGDYRFRTRLAYTGQIKGSTLVGDVYIVGGGDPTIACGDSISTPTKQLFAKWAKMLSSKGIKRVEGHIIGDGRFFDGMIEHDSWQLGDLGYDYAPGGDGLCFYENISKYRITAGKAAGDPVKVETLYPEMPWLELRTPCVTAKAGTGNDLMYIVTDMAPVAEMRGSIEAGRKPHTMSCSNKYGALTCAYYFYKHLTDAGIVVTEGPADIDAMGSIRDFGTEKLGAAASVDAMTVIGETLSPKLRDIALKCNHESDNFYAETLLRILAKERTGSACYDSCTVTRARVFESMGLDKAPQMHIEDGSGLSRQDYVSPEFFVSFLKAMRGTSAWGDFLTSLPQPGRGTLTTRMRNADEAVRARVHMKSGSMGGVRCFSGYIMPASGDSSETIVFSVLTNNAVVPVSRINFCLDKLITLMAESN